MMRFLSLVMITAACISAAETNPVVSVTGGQVAGRMMPQSGAMFKGIPYAQPPVGDLRWREPQPPKPWSGVRDAGDYGNRCMQQGTVAAREGLANHEDCLYLHIWTPEWPSKSAKPVMVWIHGGGNSSGSGSDDVFEGETLSRRGVVVVTIEYRVGIFGFFAHPGLTAESAHHASGNYGLMDQMAALRWVAANIAKFGGDPKNITMFGQSAGSWDVGYLLSSPLSKGLVQKSIQESGSPIQPVPTRAHAEELGVKFAETLKAPAGGAEAVKFLRSLPEGELQKASAAARGPNGPSVNVTVDGWVLPEHPAKTFLAGRELAIPVIVGNNAREQRGPATLEELRKSIAESFGNSAGKAEEVYGVAGNGTGVDDPLYGTAATAFSADARFRCPTVAEAVWHNAHGLTVYEYQFDLPIAGRAATEHNAEMPFVFGNLLASGFFGAPYTEADRKVSDIVQQYWVNFARTANPNGGKLPNWPKFNGSARPFLEFTKDGPVVHEGLRRDVCDLYMANMKEQHQ